MNLLNDLYQETPCHVIKTSWLESAAIKLDILRLDLTHPEVSGNKAFKLKHHLLHAQRCGSHHLVSFGGAWSNHIHALAAAGRYLGLETTGVIRGEEPESLSETLQDARQWGMRLHFVSRSDYRKRYDPNYHAELLDQLGLDQTTALIVPEGGSGELGVKGCEDIVNCTSIDLNQYDEVTLACGTGATMAGIVRAVNNRVHVRGVSVLKGGDFLREDINGYLFSENINWSLETGFHCGGYGRTTPELIEFMGSFESETGVPLDQVYTGKVMLAIKQRAEAGLIPPGSRILMVHTGGLQGRRGHPALS